MFSIDIVADIKKMFKEAQDKNYPEFILDHDLKNCLYNFKKNISSHYDEELKWVEDDSYESGKEEGFEEGHEEGYNEGKDEASDTFIKSLADHIIKLKYKIRDNPNLTHKEIQSLITELLVKMDDNEIIPYTEREYIIEEIDKERSQE